MYIMSNIPNVMIVLPTFVYTRRRFWTERNTDNFAYNRLLTNSADDRHIISISIWKCAVVQFARAQRTLDLVGVCRCVSSQISRGSRLIWAFDRRSIQSADLGVNASVTSSFLRSTHAACTAPSIQALSLAINEAVERSFPSAII